MRSNIINKILKAIEELIAHYELQHGTRVKGLQIKWIPYPESEVKCILLIKPDIEEEIVF